MNSAFYLRISILLLGILSIGCGDPSTNDPEAKGTGTSASVDPETLLSNGKLDEFYLAVEAGDLKEIRAHFESQAKAGKLFNYGILVNSDIVTANNRALFKPDIKAIRQFSNVPNENRCYMNAALYNIANSPIFDDFLESDKQFPEMWSKRKPENLRRANAVVRTLRETIYEIRLGLHTKPERIGMMRNRHIAALENLNDLDIVTSFYQELITSYEFELVEKVEIDAANVATNMFEPYDVAGLIDQIDVQATIKRSKIRSAYGIIGALSDSLAGNQDNIYLDSIFAMIDPWGKNVRYLSAALYPRGMARTKIISHDGIDGLSRDAFVFEINNSNQNLRLFHNALSLLITNTNNVHIARYFVRVIRNPISNVETGKISPADISASQPAFRLVGKSKHSTNHQIAEFFRASRNRWEQYRFIEAPKFSRRISPQNDGTYQDYLYYFEKTQVE